MLKCHWYRLLALKHPSCSIRVPSADVEAALIRSLHLNLHLTQYDLNLKGFYNPISTLNTEMPGYTVASPEGPVC